MWPFLLLLVLWPSLAEAVNRYVDSTCSNGITTYVPASRACTGGGSQSFNTIPNGLAAMRTTSGVGDTLYIRGGTYSMPTQYTGPWGCNPSCPTSWANANRVTNYPGESVLINSAGFDISGSGYSYFIMEGETRARFIHNGPKPTTSDVEGIRISNGAHHIRLKTMTIRNFSGVAGINIAAGSSPCTSAKAPKFIEVLDNEVRNNGDNNQAVAHEHGIYPNCFEDLTISGNYIVGNWAYGIHMNTGGVGGQRATINRNIIEGRLVTGQFTACLYSTTVTGAVITNNLCIGKGNQTGSQHTIGFQIESNSVAPVVYNNTIIDVSSTGIQLLMASGGTARNNLFYLAPTTVTNGGSNVVSNSYTAPSTACFVNAAILNYQLAAGCTGAINQGFLTSCLTCGTDLLGVLRTAPYDIGAYEFGGTPPPDSTPPAAPGVFLSKWKGR